MSPKIRLRFHARLLLSLSLIFSCLTGLLLQPADLVGNSKSTAHAAQSETEAVAATLLDEPEFFVRRHYADFLNREPDEAGLQFWTNQITECGSNNACAELRRINVSAAFFLSIEFQQTGYLVYRFHQAAFNTGERLPLAQFLPDTQQIGEGVSVGVGNWQQQFDNNKQAYAAGFVARAAFVSQYPATLSAGQYVDALNSNTGNSLSPAERDDLVQRLNAGSLNRAQALRLVAEDADFVRREFNRAFVLMQYFGYLRRNPNAAPEPGRNFDGFNFWLGKLDQFRGNYIAAEMVKAFISSGEYRDRFGTTRYTLFSNKADPLLLRAQTANGARVDYYGLRNSDGAPTLLTDVEIQTPDNKLTHVRFDERSRPTQIRAANGVTFTLAYGDNGQVLATAIAPNGAQISAPLPASVLAGIEQTSATGSPAAVDDENVQPDASTPTCGSGTPFSIAVTRCNGRPVDGALVEMTVIPEPATGEAMIIPARPLGNGLYCAAIPLHDPTAGARAASQCRQVQTLVEGICRYSEIYPALCPVIARVIALIPGGFVSAPAVLEACSTLAAATVLTCEFKADEITKLICDNISAVVNRELSRQLYRLRPRVSGVPNLQGYVFGDIQFVNPTQVGPFQPFAIDLGTATGCSSALRAVLTWDKTNTDVDLHLKDAQGRETYYGNKTGVPNSRLDVDDTDGFGPENLYVSPMADNTTYRVFLHYFSDHGRGTTNARVQVFLDNQLVTTFNSLLSHGQFVDVGTYSTTSPRTPSINTSQFSQENFAPVFLPKKPN